MNHVIETVEVYLSLDKCRCIYININIATVHPGRSTRPIHCRRPRWGLFQPSPFELNKITRPGGREWGANWMQNRLWRGEQNGSHLGVSE